MSFPKYPAYKDSGVEWLGEVPSHWHVTALKREYSVTLGKMLQSDASSPDDLLGSYLRAANIQWSGVDVSDIKTMWFSGRDVQQLRLLPGDLLISEGGDVGRSCLWQGELEECYFQNSVNRVRPIKGGSSRFLYYWMSTIKDKGYVDVLCNKSTIAHFTAEKVAAVPVPIPSDREQESISQFLDRETTKIDTLVAEQEQLITLLKEKRQAVISHAVTKGLDPSVPMKDSGVEWLGDVPAHWRFGSIKHFLLPKGDAIKTGPFGSHLTAADMQSGSIKVYNQRSVIDCDFESGENFITAEKFAVLRSFETFPGDLLITTRGTIGRAAILPADAERGILHPCLLRVQPDTSRLRTEFLKTLVQDSDLVRTQLSYLSNATTIEVIYSYTIASVVIPVPPATEQDEIMHFLLEELTRLETLTAEAGSTVELLHERRSALISAAVTGQIDVRQAG